VLHKRILENKKTQKQKARHFYAGLYGDETEPHGSQNVTIGHVTPDMFLFDLILQICG